jgi:hypothetical protein
MNTQGDVASINDVCIATDKSDSQGMLRTQIEA